MDVLVTAIFSLASALISSFLAAYLTYRYTELSWRRRRHFEDIKENCLEGLLLEVVRFDEHFMLRENKISSWVRGPFLHNQKPASEWCKRFSFGFDEPPATHYIMLLHDLENHFPELVNMLKRFEQRMRDLCPLYDVKYYELTKAVFDEVSRITTDVSDKSILTEAVIMTLAGYGEEYWPNDKNFLKQRGLLEHLKEIVDKFEGNKLVKEYNAIKVEGLTLTREIKEYIIKITYSNKLPGKCDLL